ncbi:MAG: hypothetical protein KYX67_13265 [Brevundimonas sp.]|uniref:hypothetical protein n=1 Tax=Brevundimonas sp. TaxID=1871086 RepID=UPI002562B4D9|nr:hypothetical protein [Brevundimonas sp.]MDK2748280.1 hypothetical protein [Brevundimonas sp.]
MTFAERLIRLCAARLPSSLREWAEAMASEAASIREPASALVFALGCIGWATRAMSVEALKHALRPDVVSVAEADAPSPFRDGRGRWPAVACAITASSLGLIYLKAAEAPLTLLTMNFAALVAGLVIVLPLSRRTIVRRPISGFQALFIGAALILTAAFGSEAAGATRWLLVGEVIVQPSLILLPLLVVSFARSRDVLAATGIILAGVALAWQPDRAMAGALFAGVAVIALAGPSRSVRAPLAVCAAAFVTTLTRPDAVPATPFVDRVFSTAFTFGPVIGIVVWGGAAVLLLPALLGWVRDRAHRPIHLAFAAIWAAIVLAAVIGNYPAPLVAYGGSAIIGYLLATLALPRYWSAAIPASRSQAHPEPPLGAEQIAGKLTRPPLRWLQLQRPVRPVYGLAAAAPLPREQTLPTQL